MSNDHRKMAWVAWDKVLNARPKGGLQIGSIRAQNLALLAKWWWRFLTEEEILWKKVITAFHAPSGNIGVSYRQCNRSGTWGNIAALQKAFEPYNLNFNSLFQRPFGDGANIKFWLESGKVRRR